MSITFDPQKWSNPLRKKQRGAAGRKKKKPVLISLKDLVFFRKLRGEELDDKNYFAQVKPGDARKIARPTVRRKLRTIKRSTLDD